DAVASAVERAFVDEVLNSPFARRSTVFVQKGVRIAYQTPTGKYLINKVASTSLNKSVQGAAAISHVSKILRTRGITSVGAMFVNDGRVLYRYCNGEISEGEVVKGVFSETMGLGGDMMGWILGASLAAAFLFPPYGAVVTTTVGSMCGRMVGQSLA
ncbi:hypothetical protein C8A03DRAFT_18558, partial [Achaetomium macrosporum]